MMMVRYARVPVKNEPFARVFEANVRNSSHDPYFKRPFGGDGGSPAGTYRRTIGPGHIEGIVPTTSRKKKRKKKDPGKGFEVLPGESTKEMDS
jgi:hypothetical protein